MLGYVEGKNIVYEYSNAENKPERLPAFVEESIRLKVDVSSSLPPPMKRAPPRVPPRQFPWSVSTSMIPSQSGLIDSLARPGANLTGFTQISGELSGKRLELLKETVAKLARVAVLWDPKAPAAASDVERTPSAGERTGVAAAFDGSK